MQNNPEVIQKAKRYVRRYKIWCTVFAMCIVLGYCLVALQGNILYYHLREISVSYMYENYVYVCVNVPTFLFLLGNFLV